MFTITVGRVGSLRTKQDTVSSREIFVGRAEDCDLVLRDETVSGVHCRLVAIEGGAVVVDEGSTNGTWLNSERVSRTALMGANDTMRVGPFVLTVHSLVSASAAGYLRERRARPRESARPTQTGNPVNQGCWAVLDLQVGAPFGEARAAYHQMIAQYHPDKVAHLGHELRALAERKCREINSAWEFIERFYS
ncbi:FHA domain-containing protein [Myxococcus vastator]|uniref:FHA domain-containing protein n=1 Tax=Myxococcus vastator TaxID=2709664 RepID=UPI0013D5B325|nr:FHA domain-containing protein [Myxococcus vastator]